MTRIIELAHMLGEEIAKSTEIENLEVAKGEFQKDEALQAKMSEYETERRLLGEEFSKEAGEVDPELVKKLRARIEELSAEIAAHPKYQAFSAAQAAMNSLMADVNAEIKFCITGERPEECTHDCSTCSGCH